MRRPQIRPGWLPPLLSLLLLVASSLQVLVHAAPPGSALSDVCLASPADPSAGRSPAESAAGAPCALCIAALHTACVGTLDTAPTAFAAEAPSDLDFEALWQHWIEEANGADDFPPELLDNVLTALRGG